MIFQQTIDELLDFRKINNELIYKKDFDADTFKRTILSKLNLGCFGTSSDIVILEPGANPNSDKEILRVAKMYKEDFSIEDHSFLKIVTDEAIYQRMKTSEIMDDNNDKDICLKMAIRIINFDLQQDALSAASPLFASTAKFNYTTTIAHFLSTIAAHPRFEEKLCHYNSFKIPNENLKNTENVIDEKKSQRSNKGKRAIESHKESL
ncbi:hypothetical protein C1645_836097 [Glomus cerebriforme]|uniref:Uncharacterized protein n=1 Tax=Glomus cerebriforme TaxID=658196 RepID=A0A397SCE5_9GLOM|nr:hypothetical protein C1645_836097 [Glomus cerebriforme]